MINFDNPVTMKKETIINNHWTIIQHYFYQMAHSEKLYPESSVNQ